MRHLSFAGVLGALVVVGAMASLTGCAGSQAKGPEDALTVLNRELAMTLPEPVGTTTLTSAGAASEKSVLEEQGPMPLPEDRMPLSGVRTWGTASSAPAAPSLEDISATRE